MIGRDRNVDDGLDFESWYAISVESVTVRVVSAVGDPVLGRELSAEAFARAYEKWNRVSTMESPEGWVYRTALNLSRRTWRRRQIEKRAVAKLEAGMVRSEEAWVPGVTTGEIEIRGHSGGAVADAVGELPPRMRTAVELRYWEELSEDEVADKMGTTPGSASATLSNARRKLKRDLLEGGKRRS